MKQFILTVLLLTTIGFSQLSYADGCSLTKTLYDSGKYARAYKLAKTYANYDNACAEFYLGLMYLNGQGVETDTAKGDAYIRSAVKRKFQPAIDFVSKIIP